MDKQTARRYFASSSAHERLIGARFFSDHSEPEDREFLEHAYRNEDVSYVRKALEDALSSIANAGNDRPPTQLDLTPSDEDVKNIRAQAVYETAGILVHEIEKILGLLRVYAGQEIGNFDQSKTKSTLDNLEALLSAIARLRRAATAPRTQEFDLAETVSTLIERECRGHEVDIQRGGPAPFIVTSDPALIDIALSNGLRNAVESTESVPQDRRQPIVVAWGNTPKDFWISVIDQGIGFHGSVERVFEIGATSKLSHLGMGLPIARQAIESLGGKLSLVPKEIGARLEIRWPKSSDETSAS